MKVINTSIPDVIILEPQVFGDERGFFIESYNKNVFNEIMGKEINFVQDNHSRSSQNVLRGLHYQIQQPQGKLVRVILGEILDVAVDLRQNSATFGQWVSAKLNTENKHQLWIPQGFAHGFLVLSEYAEVLYKTTDFYAPSHERCLLWNDPDVAIFWNLDREPVLSNKDKNGKLLKEADLFA